MHRRATRRVIGEAWRERPFAVKKALHIGQEGDELPVMALLEMAGSSVNHQDGAKVALPSAPQKLPSAGHQHSCRPMAQAAGARPDWREIDERGCHPEAFLQPSLDIPIVI
jgi:hypothetical protein